MPLRRIIADQVVALARQLVGSAYFCVRIRPGNSYRQHRKLGRGLPGFGGQRLQGQHSLISSQEQFVSAAPRQEFHGGIALSAIRLENQRKVTVGSPDLGGIEAGVLRRNWGRATGCDSGSAP